MLIKEKFFSKLILFIFIVSILQSCGKKEEQQTFIPPNQDSTVDKEKERKEREEFERLKNLQNGGSDSTKLKDSLSAAADSLKAKSDSAKTQTNDKKKFVQKEKELNKRLDNPQVAINDYIEFLKRGTSEGGNFEQNMKKASDQWQTPNLNRFKSNYKNTTKLTVLEEPRVISQKGNEAVVEVKLKKTDKKNNKTEDTEMTVRYNLVADAKGKWKIKSNTVSK